MWDPHGSAPSRPVHWGQHSIYAAAPAAKHDGLSPWPYRSTSQETQPAGFSTLCVWCPQPANGWCTMIPNSLELCKKWEDPLPMSCFLEADVIMTPMSSRRQFVCRASCVPSEVWARSVKFRMALFSFRRMLSEAETSCGGLSQIVEECRWVATLAPEHQSKW